MMERCYWDYVRLLVPGGSRLTAATPLPLPEGSLLRTFRGVQSAPDTVTVEVGEAGTAAFAAFFVVRGGESRQVKWAYSLPSAVAAQGQTSSHYHLLVQKQAGTQALPLTVKVSLPPGARLVASRPAPKPAGAGQLIFELSLQTDQSLDVWYR
jgi:hypothetical protein